MVVIIALEGISLAVESGRLPCFIRISAGGTAFLTILDCN